MKLLWEERAGRGLRGTGSSSPAPACEVLTMQVRGWPGPPSSVSAKAGVAGLGLGGCRLLIWAKGWRSSRDSEEKPVCGEGPPGRGTLPLPRISLSTGHGVGSPQTAAQHGDKGSSGAPDPRGPTRALLWNVCLRPLTYRLRVLGPCGPCADTQCPARGSHGSGHCLWEGLLLPQDSSRL